MKIIAVDWGKDARKRAAYVADPASRTVSRLPFGGSLAQLAAHASSLTGPVLIGIDAAIGFPASSWQRLARQRADARRTFADFLLGPSLPAGFFEPVATPGHWSPLHPFIRPPRGPWSLQAFIEASDHGLYRAVDKRLHANPIFVTSGMPGTVGSGTRALWQELAEQKPSSGFRLWPFHGSLPKLLASNRPVIAEIYPKACYGIALAASLPTRMRSIAKTKARARAEAIRELLDCAWVKAQRVTIRDVDNALANEDDFDALFSATALLRIYLERAPFESPATVDAVAEGGVLGAASVNDPASPSREARKKRPGTARPMTKINRT